MWHQHTFRVSIKYVNHRDLSIYLPRLGDAENVCITGEEISESTNPLQRLHKARKYWSATLEQHLICDYHVQSADGDSAPYVKVERKLLIDFIWSYGNDRFRASCEDSQAVTLLDLKKYESERRIFDKLDFLHDKLKLFQNISLNIGKHYAYYIAGKIGSGL